jgi:alkylhydroperoxidase family enzyme
MPRIAYGSPAGPAEAEMRARRGGTLTPLDLLLLHNDPLAQGWNALLGAVRSRFTLSDDLRELIILRVGHVNGASYEWHAHVDVGRRAGLTEDVLEVIASDSAQTGDPVYDVILRYTDEMTRNVTVEEATFAALTGRFTDQQVAEITATVAAYNMVSRFLVALDVHPHDRDAVTTTPEEVSGSARS